MLLMPSSGSACDMQHMQFVERMQNHGGEFRVREFAAAEPMKFAAEGVVLAMVVVHGWCLDMQNAQPIAWNRDGTMRRTEHFQIVDGDVNDLQEVASSKPCEVRDHFAVNRSRSDFSAFALASLSNGLASGAGGAPPPPNPPPRGKPIASCLAF